jgi:hypothetical protein
MTFASAQLYLRDIELVRGMWVCGNRSDVQNWNVNRKIFEDKNQFLFRHMFIFFLFRSILFH